MAEGAKKSAAELAAELVATTPSITSNVVATNDGDITQHTENLQEIEVGKLTEPTLQLHYDIVTDSITGNSPNVHEQNVMILKGRVTEATLKLAGVDIEWLKRIGSIEEAGYHLV